MQVRSWLVRGVAAATALVLAGVTANALLTREDPQDEAPGMSQAFARVDTRYQQSTREFSERAKSLSSADLATALTLYGNVLDAARDARAGVQDLPDIDTTSRAKERLDKALQVQEQALEQTIDAARNKDDKGTAAAAQVFTTAVLAYQAARQQMLTALAECGRRCR